MNRNKKNQILAIVGLFAIVFSIVSTALLVIFASRSTETTKISDFIPQAELGTGQLDIATITGSTTTGSTTDK